MDVGPVRVEQEARTILEEQVKKIENMGCAVAQSHVRMGDAAKEVVNLAEEIGVSLVAVGSRGRDKESAYGKRLPLRRKARSLPRYSGARLRGEDTVRP